MAQTVTQHGGWVKAGASAQGGAEFTVQLSGASSLETLKTPLDPFRNRSQTRQEHRPAKREAGSAIQLHPQRVRLPQIG